MDRDPSPHDATLPIGEDSEAAPLSRQLQGQVFPQIEGFEIKSVIGVGGMGIVYEAQQLRPRRAVAIKVINTGVASPESLRRFELEAQVLTGRVVVPQFRDNPLVAGGFGSRRKLTLLLVNKAIAVVVGAVAAYLDRAAR